MSILLISSDARPRYAQDILSTAAAPVGSLMQFRYESAYIAQDFSNLVASQTVNGSGAVVCFVGAVGTPSAFIYPVRFVTVVKAHIVADTVIVRFRIGNYPDVTSLPRVKADLERASKATLDGVMARYGRYYPAVAHSDGMAISQGNSSTENWAEVINRLSLFDAYANTYFMKLTVEKKFGRAWKGIELPTGGLTMSSRSMLILRSWYYGASHHGDSRAIQVRADDGILRIASDARYEISSRYDDVEFWVHARQVPERSRTILSVDVPGDPSRAGDLPTRVTIPVMVHKPVISRIFRGSAAASGASLVAAPALMGIESPLLVRIIIASAGALIIALLAVFQ